MGEVNRKHGAWQTVLIDISEDTQLSAECDLGYDFTHILVLVPTITSAGLSVRVAKGSGGTYYPVYDFLDVSADTDVLQATLAETTSKAIVFKIGSARYIKLYADAEQTTTDKTFYVKGFDM
jgi:hypothetical protein